MSPLELEERIAILESRVTRSMELMLKFASLRVHRDNRDEWKQLAAERWKLEEEIENESM